MNIARTICYLRHRNIGRNFIRDLRISSVNNESTQASQPKVQEEKFDFEDLKVIEREIRHKPKIPPFMKNIFVSIFNRDLLAYPEVLNKDESELLDQRVDRLEAVFNNPEKSQEDRRNALKNSKMYAAPVSWTRNGLAMNYTECIRYLEVISSDIELAQEISDHWVGLEAIRQGLTEEQYNQIIDDLITGDRTITLSVKERVAERITQPDFRTVAEMDANGVWRITGEKICVNSEGYYLVLCAVEASRLKAFLIHPSSPGVSNNDIFVTFKQTPATPLEEISDEALGRTLGISRLHAATMCRCSLKRAMHACVDYVTPRAFSGKPLSEMPSIRATIGSTLLTVYAGESGEYFTAGLLDGYADADAELEVAMCRNFMANRGIGAMIDLLSIPALEKGEECIKLLNDLRYLSTRGDSVDSINMFIAMNGLHHAGKMIAEEVKKIRNPLFNPTFIFKKIIADRHQEKDNPKLNLYLAEHLHPSLQSHAEQLEYCTVRMRYATETLMSRHGIEVASAQTELNRLAEAATEILIMSAVLARASRSYCIGLRNAAIEMKLAACFVEKSKDIVKRLILEIDNGEYLNLDHFKIQFGKKVLDTKTVLVEKPTARVFW